MLTAPARLLMAHKASSSSSQQKAGASASAAPSLNAAEATGGAQNPASVINKRDNHLSLTVHIDPKKLGVVIG